MSDVPTFATRCVYGGEALLNTTRPTAAVWGVPAPDSVSIRSGPVVIRTLTLSCACVWNRLTYPGGKRIVEHGDGLVSKHGTVLRLLFDGYDGGHLTRHQDPRDSCRGGAHAHPRRPRAHHLTR